MTQQKGCTVNANQISKSSIKGQKLHEINPPEITKVDLVITI